MSLAARSTADERMDTDCVDYDDYRRCLRDLARVNTVTLTHRPMLAWLARETAGLQCFSLLDVACGHGDALRRIRRWATQRGIAARLRRRGPQSVGDARGARGDDRCGGRHHLSHRRRIRHRRGRDGSISSSARSSPIISPMSQVVTFIRWMEAHARRGWFIGDLHRHWLPYYGFGVLAWLARWHHFVLSDGRISIARAFVPADWRQLIRAAGSAERDVSDQLASAVPALRRTALSGPVIIGGGPAGAAAAISLARAGHAVTLIERSVHASDKVCGDFLSAEAIETIEGLGVDLSAASTITAVPPRAPAIALSPRACRFAARGLSRRALDEALLRQAQAHGATVLRGHRVRAIRQDGGSLRLDCGSLGSVVADSVFLATGKHELRGAARTGHDSGLVGLKMYYALATSQLEALRDHVELILVAGGYAGLQLVEADRAVLCVLVPRGKAPRRRRCVGQTARCTDG